MFKKFPSIENHYITKNIVYFLSIFPELENETFVVQEKIHGTNIQLIFTPDGEMKIASRNRILENGENFFGVFEFIDNGSIDKIITVFKEKSKNENITISLFGEFFGKGIMKGVEYGSHKQMMFFDMAIDGDLIPPKIMISIFMQNNLNDFLVPCLSIDKGIESALAFDCDIPSFLNPKEGNIMEGIVIKPYNKQYVDNRGKTFYLKKKNTAFFESSHKKKRVRDQKETDPIVSELKDKFSEYITESRLQNVFSKYGVIDDIRDMGKYIGFMLEDAKEDFLKERSIDNLDKKQKKEVFNFGKEISEMLKTNL